MDNKDAVTTWKVQGFIGYLPGTGDKGQSNSLQGTVRQQMIIRVWIRYELLSKPSRERAGVEAARSMGLEAGVPSVLEMDIFMFPACRCVGKIV